MKALPFFMLLIPSLLLSSVLFLNTYDGSGYLFSKGKIDKFFFGGACKVEKDTIVGVYKPPDIDINLLLAFPTSEMLVLKSGATIGVKGSSITVNKDIYKLIKEKKPEEILCWELPGLLISATEVILFRDLDRFTFGSLISPILNRLKVPYEIPKLPFFRKAQTIVLTPSPPVLSVKTIRLEGQGSLVIADVTDSSTTTVEFIVNGEERFSRRELILLPPGKYKVTAVATDTFGLSASKTVEVFSKAFIKESTSIKVEIGFPVDEFVKSHVPPEVLKTPGKHAFYDLKPYGLFKFIIEATDSIYPEISYQIEGDMITAEASDVNGATAVVFVNGKAQNHLDPGKNTVIIVAVDSYGNTTMKTLNVEYGKEVLALRRIVEIGGIRFRSPFVKRLGGN